MADEDTRLGKINDVRAVLDFLEATPDVPLPSMHTFNAWASSDELATIARALGHCEKVVVSTIFVLSRRFGSVKYDVNFDRDEVCTATVIGTELIPEKLIPAYTKDIVEWECPDSILDRPDTR